MMRAVFPVEVKPFDAITRRFCPMVLPEIPKVIAEIGPVLTPGGWVAAAVSSPPEQTLSIDLSMKAIRKVIDLPRPH